METIAVYWEPVIHTYGIAGRTGLVLASADLPAASGAARGLSLTEAAAPGELLLAMAHPAGDGRLRLHLVVRAGSGHPLAGLPGARRPSERPAALFSWQGPHYGDRYGIADAALQALVTARLPLLAFACTGSSLYLVVPEKAAGGTRAALEATFPVPDGDRSEAGR